MFEAGKSSPARGRGPRGVASVALRCSLAGALLYAAVVVAAALWPFTFVAVCTTCVNHAVAGHGVSFPSAGLVQSAEPARALRDRLVASGAFTVEVRVTPSRTRQVGPARIVGLSDGPFRRNFTLAQEGRDLVFRLRTSGTDPNGLSGEVALADVFRAGEERHLVATYREGTIGIFVDGRRSAAFAGPGGRLDAGTVATRCCSATSAPGTGRGSARSSGSRSTIASSRQAEKSSIATQLPLGAAGSAPAFALAPRSAAVSAPFELSGYRGRAAARGFRALSQPGRGRPFAGRAGQSSGLLTPFGLMLPFGLLVGFWARERRRMPAGTAAVVAIAAAGALALACELLQTFAAERSSSIVGLAGGVLGGALGALIAVQRVVPLGRDATSVGLLLRRSVGTAVLLYLLSCLALAAHIGWLERFGGPPRPARLIVVLGGGPAADGGLSGGSRRRTEAGIALYRPGSRRGCTSPARASRAIPPTES